MQTAAPQTAAAVQAPQIEAAAHEAQPTNDQLGDSVGAITLDQTTHIASAVSGSTSVLRSRSMSPPPIPLHNETHADFSISNELPELSTVLPRNDTSSVSEINDQPGISHGGASVRSNVSQTISTIGGLARTGDDSSEGGSVSLDDDERQRLLADSDSATLAPAFREYPAVRLAYLHAVLGNIFGSLTVLEAEEYLCDTYDIIRICGKLPTYPKPAKSLSTAKKRLGLDIDSYIERIPICTACFKPYSLEDIEQLNSPSCTVSRCNGVVYHIKHTLDNNLRTHAATEKRVPAKIQPYASLITALRRFCMRADFVANLRDSSGDTNRTRVADDELMYDIYDSEAWGSFEVGLQRVVDADGSVRDVEIAPGTRQSLIQCDLGLSLTLNVDWSVSVTWR